MNEEIFSGLKNAKERGSSVEEAAQSFINAGYNPSEVREAASFLSKGFSPLPTVAKEEGISKEGVSVPAPKKEVSKKTIWIIIILLALVLLAVALSFILFRDKFLSIIDSIFP
jgi:hypothetical protein